MSASYQHISNTKYKRNSKFGILHLHNTQMLLQTFYKDRTNNFNTGAHGNFKNITVYGRNYLLVNSNVFRLYYLWRNGHKFFFMVKTTNLQNMVWMAFTKSLQGHTKIFIHTCVYHWIWLKVYFELLYAIFKYIYFKNTIW